MKLLTIVGARPQFIKAAVLSRAIRDTDRVEERLVHTGQHYDDRMSDVFFQELELPRPHYSLEIGSGTHARQTGAMMAAIEEVLIEERPDAVVVYGDTNSTLAGSLAAAKLNQPIAHIEAGLRSFDRTMPEEVNRCVTDHLSTWHFCPTDGAVDNLRREGITQHVFQIGDVMYDALAHYSRDDHAPEALGRLNLAATDYALCTLHRASNTDDPERLRGLWESINDLARELPVVLPLHPRTRKAVAALRLAPAPGLHLVEPVGYREMLTLERRARLIVTDSGGVQKEAYLHGVPCLTLRENTEWPETVDTGWNRLVGRDKARFQEEARRFLANGPPQHKPLLFGDGHAGQRIVQHLQGLAGAA